MFRRALFCNRGKECLSIPAPSMSRSQWAEVIVDVRVTDVDRIFHYAIPTSLEEQVQVGHRLLVPFGRNRDVEGFVVGMTTQAPLVPEEKLKPIQSIIDETPAFTADDVAVAHWMAQHYACLFVQALQCFLPPGSLTRRQTRARARLVKAYTLAITEQQARQLIHEIQNRAPRQVAVIQALLQNEGKYVKAAHLARVGGGYGPLTTLQRRGIIAERMIRSFRHPGEGLFSEDKPEPVLNDAQQRAVEQIRAAFASPRPSDNTVLLHGVTGSGKTEVYMQAIQLARDAGRGTIVLVPDIALTPQTVSRFRQRFGQNIAVLHSRLSQGERYDEWTRIQHGQADVVVGARSAVFSPVKNLGMIVIDEEHETSYKQDETPRYHARDVAKARLAQTNGLLIVGSATPALETYYKAQRGEIRCVTLPERIQNKALPRIEVVDMREELLAGNRTMFSRSLQQQLQDVLSRKEQAIVLLNRRGFATFMLCRSCGYVPRCKACGVSLTLHKAPLGLRCHYCGFWARPSKTCPQCTGPYLRSFGVGTQQVEAALRETFPKAVILRMDRDTTARKGAHERILHQFANKQADILVGTQMVAKGLDFPDVTLVGVVNADTALNFPDFRAAERTFQLLTQVAGRAGRGQEPGHVTLQTYTPDHYAIEAAKDHAYNGFVEQELSFRKQTGYPPFATLVRVVFRGEEEKDVIAAANAMGQIVHDEKLPDMDIVGPSAAPLSRLKGKTRWHMLLKGPYATVMHAVRSMAKEKETLANGVQIAIDVDPLSLL